MTDIKSVLIWIQIVFNSVAERIILKKLIFKKKDDKNALTILRRVWEWNNPIQ